MEREIYIIDENNQEYLLKYIDEERVRVQQVTRYKSDPDAIGLGMPCTVTVNELYKWPYTKGLKDKILSWHAEFPDAE